MDVADLLAFKTIPDVQLSPDGHRVAFVVSEIDAERDEYRSAIWVLAADGGRPLRFTRGPKRDSVPRWSPDGEHLAFLSDREDEKPQLYVMPAAGGEPRKLTSLDAGAGAATWSPDGTTLACFGYDLQEQGLGDPMVRVYAVASQGGAPRKVTERYDRGAVLLPPPAVTPGPVWSQDGGGLSFIAADRGNAHLVRCDLESGVTRAVVGGERQVTFASAVPGARIAFV